MRPTAMLAVTLTLVVSAPASGAYVSTDGRSDSGGYKEYSDGGHVTPWMCLADAEYAHTAQKDTVVTYDGINYNVRGWINFKSEILCQDHLPSSWKTYIVADLHYGESFFGYWRWDKLGDSKYSKRCQAKVDSTMHDGETARATENDGRLTLTRVSCGFRHGGHRHFNYSSFYCKDGERYTFRHDIRYYIYSVEDDEIYMTRVRAYDGDGSPSAPPRWTCESDRGSIGTAEASGPTTSVDAPAFPEGVDDVTIDTASRPLDALQWKLSATEDLPLIAREDLAHVFNFEESN